MAKIWYNKNMSQLMTRRKLWPTAARMAFVACVALAVPEVVAIHPEIGLHPGRTVWR